MNRRNAWRLLLSLGWRFAIVSALGCAGVRAASLDDEIDERLSELRAITVSSDPAVLDRYNSQLDSSWRLFSADKGRSLPILRARLATEIAAQAPSDFVLLDVGYFVYLNDTAQGKGIARQALEHVRLDAPIVAANKKELFEFMHAVAKDHDAAVLPLIEKAFLKSNDSIFVPQHSLTLDGTLICVFLYGAYGPESETVLRQKLTDATLAKRVIEILVWIGTPASLQEVSKALTASPNYDVTARATSYMMQTAGPAGRSYLLSVDPKTLDPQSQQYLSKVRNAVEATGFETFRAQLSGIPGDQRLADTEVLSRLDHMVENFGVDDKTSPMAVLNSGIPSQTLTDKLIVIRSRSLFRLSDEALSDVEATNVLLVALRYRPK